VPALVGENGHRHHGLAHDAVLPRGGGALLRAQRVGVRAVFGQLGQAVVQVLRGRAHRHRRGVDEPLGHEAWIEVHVVAHRVVAHVLDPAGEDDLGRAHRDLTRAGGDGGERPGAHAVDREARHALRQAGEQSHVAAERQALVADLSGRRHHDVVDPLGRQLGVAPEQLADDLDAHVVGARAPEHPFWPGPSECSSDAVDVVDLAQFPHAGDPSQSSRSRHNPVTHPCAVGRYDRRGEEVGCA